MSARRFVATLAVAALASTAGLGCSSDGGDADSSASSGSSTTAGGSGVSDDGVTYEGAAPAAGETTVVIVADSEIPTAVAKLVDDAPGLAVTSAVSIDGATMAELDETVAHGLSTLPDVFVYSGSTNDLSAGSQALLEGVTTRLESYARTTCTVMAVPIFRYHGTTDAEIEAETAGTRVLEDAVAGTGALVASYLDVSLAMREAGEDFFAEGSLGDLHPGEAAYPAIAEAIVQQIAGCPAAPAPVDPIDPVDPVE